MTGISAARARAILEEYRDFRLAHLSGGDPQDQLGELVRICFDRDVVEAEKGQSGDQTHPLVAIDEGVMLDQVEEIGRGHLGQRRMQKGAI